jgi:FKBP-type peptidyl-prolyl cis-trans isomerase
MKKFLSIFMIMIMITLAAIGQKTTPTTGITTISDSLSYSFGLLIGNNMKTQKVEGINPQILMEGFIHGYADENLILTVEQANTYVQDYFSNMVKNESAANLQESADFLEANKSKEGVVTLPSGLQYKVLEAGEGPSPTPDDQVKVHYTGTLIDGTVFDSSIERGEPIVFGVSQVIPGWTEALQLMSPGSRWMLYIPPYLAYGENGAGGVIGPNQALIFEVQLIEVIPQ